MNNERRGENFSRSRLEQIDQAIQEAGEVQFRVGDKVEDIVKILRSSTALSGAVLQDDEIYTEVIRQLASEWKEGFVPGYGDSALYRNIFDFENLRNTPLDANRSKKALYSLFGTEGFLESGMNVVDIKMGEIDEINGFGKDIQTTVQYKNDPLSFTEEQEKIGKKYDLVTINLVLQKMPLDYQLEVLISCLNLLDARARIVFTLTGPDHRTNNGSRAGGVVLDPIKICSVVERLGKNVSCEFYHLIKDELRAADQPEQTHVMAFEVIKGD